MFNVSIKVKQIGTQKAKLRTLMKKKHSPRGQGREGKNLEYVALDEEKVAEEEKNVAIEPILLQILPW